MMEPGERLVVVYLDSIDKRLLEYFDQDDEVHGPPASLARRPGVVHRAWRSLLRCGETLCIIAWCAEHSTDAPQATRPRGRPLRQLAEVQGCSGRLPPDGSQ